LRSFREFFGVRAFSLNQNIGEVMFLSENSFSEKMKQKRCFIGFDAFIDYITRPIAGKAGGEIRYFHDLDEYAAFLREQKNKSFSVELEIPEVKIGGNNPNISDIMSRFGVEVVTFGAYGKPAPDPVFLPLSRRCRMISFADPGKCTAYEFSVNKMMNFYNMDPRDFTYKNLLNFISEEEIMGIMEQMDMIVFVNLGEQPAVLNIMEMFLERIFPGFTAPKIFFMDFSDCSRMSPGELSRGLDILRALRGFGHTVLSVNENEFRILSRHTGLLGEPGFREDVPVGTGALRLFRQATLADRVILRTLRAFYYSSPGEDLEISNRIVENPRYLTGAGDAQNAGICLGLLAGLSTEETLLAGIRAGTCYIHTSTVDFQFIEGVKA
jgi:hypothetical protein